jgi:tetratricopeptide (TPR) repeat protein
LTDLRAQLQSTLGDAYALERELGGGGMSRVFVAEETRLRRKVVIKVLSPELTQGISVERFEREIQTAAALQQANIVPVLSAGDTNGLPYYSMPFVEGQSLRSRLAGGPLAITEVIGVLRDVSKALAFAHERGVVHRDIKPDNVLLSGGTAVVTDFGIAKALSAARTGAHGATLTQIGTSIGTPAYMAPEQAAGDPGVDHRADIYSLGCLAFELLTGQPPFAGRTPTRTLAAHMGETPAHVGELRPDTPDALVQVVMACLEKEPSARPQQAGDVVRVLDTITSGGGMSAMPAVLLGGRGMFRKALAIYAGAFVAVAILAKAAIVGIGLPDWVFPGSLIVMALGLPVVLWTGYVQRVARRAFTQTPTYTPGGTPGMAAHGTIATMALKAAPHVSWYRTARGGMYAMGGFVALIAGFMVLRALGVGPVGSLMAAGKLARKEPIVLTDFRVTGADSSLGRVVSDAVRAGLSQSSVIALMAPASIASALERMQRPSSGRMDLALARELATREGVKAIVDGDITGVGTGYIVQLRLVTADSGLELASFRQTGDGPRGLIDAADKLARALREKVGESLRSVHASPPLADVTTASLEALKKYGEGVRANDIESAWAQAVVPLREAVAIDSTFAMAWRKLAVAMSNAGMPRSGVDSAIARAWQFRDRLPETERVWTTTFYFDGGPGRDRARAAATYEEMLRKGDTSLGVNHGNLLLARREFARAESLFRAYQRNSPETSFGWTNLAWSLTDLGRYDEALTVLAEAKPRFPQNPAIPLYELVVLENAKRFEDARRLADSARASRDPALRTVGLTEVTNLQLLNGQLASWRATRTEWKSHDAGIGIRIPPIFDSMTVGMVEAIVRGDRAGAAARLDRALQAVPLRTIPVADRPYLQVATAYARAGRPDRGRAILAQRQSEVTDTAMLREESPRVHRVLGELLLAEKKPLEAMEEFRKGDVAPDGPVDECIICLPYSLARSYDAAGQADSAIVMYERYVGTPFAWRVSFELVDPVQLPGVYERLATLYEKQGNAAKARMNYQAFIDLWKDADSELQPRVAEARRRLQQLRP